MADNNNPRWEDYQEAFKTYGKEQKPELKNPDWLTSARSQLERVKDLLYPPSSENANDAWRETKIPEPLKTIVQIVGNAATLGTGAGQSMEKDFVKMPPFNGDKQAYDDAVLEYRMNKRRGYTQDGRPNWGVNDKRNIYRDAVDRSEGKPNGIDKSLGERTKWGEMNYEYPYTKEEAEWIVNKINRDGLDPDKWK